MVTFAPLKLDPTAFKGVRSLLVSGVGFFIDGTYRYVVADSDSYRIDVVRRTADIKWSETVQALPKLFKAVVNGGYFSGTSLYVRAQLGVVKPGDVDSDGDVKQGGAIVLPDDGKGSSYFFFGHDGGSPPIYDAGTGNPGSSVSEGMGGLGPMILPNPVSKQPLKFGIGNRYASDPAKSTIPTAKDFADCILRNNNTYAAIQKRGQGGDGFCVVAVQPADKLLLFVIKPQGEPGDLDTLRDGLFNIGCTLACFTDGASSTCMAVDGVMPAGLQPSGTKDNLIETGFGLFLFKLPPPTKLTVTWVTVEVFDDGSTFGSGEWTLDVDVNGSKLNLLSKVAVDTGDTISFDPSKVVTVTVPPGGNLVVTSSGIDEDGIDDDLGTATDTFGPTNAPPFGVGRHLLTTNYYRLTYDVALSP
jgi:hypothetical protein